MPFEGILISYRAFESLGKLGELQGADYGGLMGLGLGATCGYQLDLSSFLSSRSTSTSVFASCLSKEVVVILFADTGLLARFRSGPIR